MDYSFYSSPAPSVVAEFEEENIKDKRLFDEWFGCVAAEEVSPSIATTGEEGVIDKQLFNEWFGCLTEEKEAERHPSLHVPTYDARRSYSQTLV